MSIIFIKCNRHIAVVTLLLCGMFLQSCTEEMPILTPLSDPNTSRIVLNIKYKTYKIIDKLPGYVFFANVTVGSGNTLYSQYNVSGSNSSQTNAIDYLLTFGPDSVNTSNYVFGTSQLTFNNKTYTTTNKSGKAIIKVDALDTYVNTASGSFAYYLYDNVLSPTDSIYVTGTFNIIK
ncbi:MAG: hypothetical protein ACRYFA_05995 [Janthinobacterium lividum]